ncbi:hypothetical protein [Limnoglobus roseus]|uniref:SMI1/KNR4 family protein n=1 Tax=Limnoglobus roseus TaxID=2598579 RepID=A0A5C1A7R5_9BACT|nr:hypothetical protein [Limnoglobus roseus]QEL14273.1 hypothetical protein PX52LOC_01144 [Limnoglobus roseus]
MTEAEWRGAKDLGDWGALLTFLGPAPRRKRRLFAVACCRRVWNLIADRGSRAAVEAAERFADGECDADELSARAAEAYAVADGLTEVARGVDGSECENPAMAAAVAAAESARGESSVTPQTVFDDAVWSVTWHARDALGSAEYQRTADDASAEAVVRREGAAQIELFCCVFNPFAPAFDPSWVSDTARSLAEAAYENRSFDRLPILADALEDAGCEEGELLGHLRGGGLHARGCWVVDLMLGRK